MNKSSFPFSIVAISILIGAIFILVNLFSVDEQEYLLQNGIQAEAEVLSLKDSGNHYNTQPEIVLKLKITPAEEAPYEAELKMIIAKIQIPDLKPGKKLKVRYDPADKMKIALEKTENGE